MQLLSFNGVIVELAGDLMAEVHDMLACVMLEELKQGSLYRLAFMTI